VAPARPGPPVDPRADRDLRALARRLLPRPARSDQVGRERAAPPTRPGLVEQHADADVFGAALRVDADEPNPLGDPNPGTLDVLVIEQRDAGTGADADLYDRADLVPADEPAG
jgi:hypothetical protein